MPAHPSRRQLLAGAVGAAAGLAACSGDRSPTPSRPTTSLTLPPTAPPPPPTAPTAAAAPTRPVDPAEVARRFADRTPTRWGLDVDGVDTRVADTAGPSLALTFDACGGPGSDGVDTALLDLLEREAIPATLFLNERWIDANPATVERLLARADLFELANHGTRHLPLSVSGRGAYGIRGTASSQEVVDEVWGNHERLTTIVGRPPRWFRSGTAHYDEVATAIVQALGEQPVGFAVNGDAGATLSAGRVRTALTAPPPTAGAVVIMHMIRPGGGTAGGLAAALPALWARGTRFVTVSGGGGATA